MDREYLIDQFLKQYAELYKQNPRLEISRDTLYSGLCSYGLTQQEYKNSGIKNYFNTWIKHFRSRGGINVYRDKRQECFLQFRNPSLEKKYEHGEFVKLYLSFNKENICECVAKIFEFIEEQGICSYSKVADEVRSDSVVLRIGDIEQAKMVMDYVNNNQFLVDNSRPVNPFLAKEGIVGMAFDGRLSYNETLSILLEKYFNLSRERKSLDSVSTEDFQRYVQLCEKKLLASPSEFNQFLNDSDNIKRFEMFSTTGALANNYIQIIRLIEKSLDKNYKMSQYEETYKNFVQEINDKNLNTSYSRFLSYEAAELYSDTDKQLLDDYIKYAAQKYGAKKVYSYLTTYMGGLMSGITKDDDFRQKFHKHLSRGKIINITNNNLNGYITSILNQSKSYTTEAYNQFYNACMVTYLAYGPERLKVALENALKQDYSYFVNEDGNSRDYMIDNFNQDIINKCIVELGQMDESNVIQGCILAIKTDLQKSVKDPIKPFHN